MTCNGLALRHDTEHDGLRGAGRVLLPEEEWWNLPDDAREEPAPIREDYSDVLQLRWRKEDRRRIEKRKAELEGRRQKVSVPWHSYRRSSAGRR